MTELAGADNIKGDSAVTYISGATISSNGVYQEYAWRCSNIKQFKEVLTNERKSK